MRRALPLLVWLSACASVFGQHWPSFRGPNASGVADGHPTPVKWNATSGESVLWKTPIPGMAVSSPIVWGDRVFVSTAVSSDRSEEHTSELQSPYDLVCRLLLEKKKKHNNK